MTRNLIFQLIDAFVRSQEAGFVYLSFGTVAKAPSLPPALIKIFFNVIKSFPEINFIWKWDGDKPEREKYPKNLFLISWVDQQDFLGMYSMFRPCKAFMILLCAGCLAHPKIRGFLTQAGRPSTQEALYHEVPMITFPILGGWKIFYSKVISQFR